MVAKPRPSHVERDDECVGLLELVQDPLRPGRVGEQVGELAVHAVENGGAQEQLTHLVGLALEHLSEQVIGDGALAARELGDEPLRIWVVRQRERRQPQPGRPALGAPVQAGDALIGKLDA